MSDKTTNTQKIANLLSTCVELLIPLNKGALYFSGWNDSVDLTFKAADLTIGERQNLKRVCSLTVSDGEGSKSLGGMTENGQVRVTITEAMTCEKVYATDLNVVEADQVLADFKSGKNYVMRCTPNLGATE
jgi:hypothetical protein